MELAKMSKKMKVIGCNALSIRKEPNEKSLLVSPFVVLADGVVILIEKLNNGWSKITFNGVEGFVLSKHIKEC